uniref:Tyrosine specific protein phosphatases domain-containing protein n=1 Tax=Pyrodinium bahamense TaxID=73915 RepID=A0A7R9ZX64_9DINO
MKVDGKEVSLLPGRLRWAPGKFGTGVTREVLALQLCSHGGGKAGEYRVPHYSRQALGAAFGPLDLGALVRFCRGLEVALSDTSKAGELFVTTPLTDKEYFANASVLIGAYMILKHEWSVSSLVDAMGAQCTDAKFVCSWTAKKNLEQDRVMRVRHCWEGISLAVRCRWINASFVDDDLKADVGCMKYESRIYGFDAAWIIPGSLMVGADPTTVTYDPNPVTCKALLPGKEEPIASLPASPCGVEMHTPASRLSSSTVASVDTVCKEYRDDFSDDGTVGQTVANNPPDYVSFLQQSCIGLVVRVNYEMETGMPQKSYADDVFEPWGIAQQNIPVVDTQGGLPRGADVALMIEACEGYAETGCSAVLVHCKGGFGRSAVLACCLAIYRLDIPGAAMLGWARIARPGAITTVKQELFLISLKGRREVMRYARMGSSDAFGGASCASEACGGTCTTQ